MQIIASVAIFSLCILFINFPFPNLLCACYAIYKDIYILLNKTYGKIYLQNWIPFFLFSFIFLPTSLEMNV